MCQRRKCAGEKGSVSFIEFENFGGECSGNATFSRNFEQSEIFFENLFGKGKILLIFVSFKNRSVFNVTDRAEGVEYAKNPTDV